VAFFFYAKLLISCNSLLIRFTFYGTRILTVRIRENPRPLRLCAHARDRIVPKTHVYPRHLNPFSQYLGCPRRQGRRNARHPSGSLSTTNRDANFFYFYANWFCDLQIVPDSKPPIIKKKTVETGTSIMAFRTLPMIFVSSLTGFVSPPSALYQLRWELGLCK
jgi:hypothetical protein